MEEILYPLKFMPVYQQESWAGSLMRDYLRVDTDRPPPMDGAAISWELVDDPQVSSMVANGPLAGIAFSDLVRDHPQKIVGARHSPGMPFPVCVRLLDVGQRQPLMVHPEKPFSCGGRHVGPSTKFWFSLAMAKNARITVGIEPGVTGLRVLEHLNTFELEKLLQVFLVRPGDSFFIPNQRVHSIGAGNLVWELQERVALPVHVTNWDAVQGVDESEQQQALGCIRFQDRQLGRMSRDAGKILHTRKIPLLHFLPQFVVDEIRMRDHFFDRTSGASFHLLGMVKGKGEIHTAAGVETLIQGSVVCIPAALGDYKVYACEGTASLLRVQLQKVS